MASPLTQAVEAGGCAPPIIVSLEQREIDRAHVEAGIMTLAEYIALYGRENSDAQVRR